MAKDITSDIQNAKFRQKTLLQAIAMMIDVIITMNAASHQSDFV